MFGFFGDAVAPESVDVEAKQKGRASSALVEEGTT
jgi:hypothetical protein